MRVSVVVFDSDVARAVTDLVVFCVDRAFETFRWVVLRVVLVVVVPWRDGFKTVVRGVVVRSGFATVVMRFCVDAPARDALFPSRTAALAEPIPIATAMTKIRIFFISDEILAKFGNSEQAKYNDFCIKICDFGCGFTQFFLLQKYLCCVMIHNALKSLGTWRHTSQQGKHSAAERERVVSVKHEQL